ncbi:hypothetical protein ABZ319_19705 [Nocardia sp. NPDC005978]
MRVINEADVPTREKSQGPVVAVWPDPSPLSQWWDAIMDGDPAAGGR